MVRRVAVLTFPSVRTSEDRCGDAAPFSEQAMAIVRRNASDRSEYDQLRPSQSDAQAVFSSWPHGNVDAAFRALKDANPERFDKIYVLAHGNEEGIEDPSWKGGAIPPDRFVAGLMDHGGLGEAIERRLKAQMQSMARQKNKPAAFEGSIRLLACNTGRGAEPQAAGATGDRPEGYLDALAQQLAGRIDKVVRKVRGESVNRSGASRALKVEIDLAAPLGWTVVLRNGQTVAYHAPSSQERSADKSMRRLFNQFESKQKLLALRDLPHFVIRDDQKKRVLKVQVHDYGNGDMRTEIEQVKPEP